MENKIEYEDFFEDIFPQVSEITFKTIPKLEILSSICNYSNNLKIYLPDDVVFDMIGDGEEGYISSSIARCNLRTDVFVDYVGLYSYSSLEELTITADCSGMTHLDLYSDDLSNMQQAIANLQELKKLRFNFIGNNEIIQEIQSFLIFPCSNFTVEYNVGRMGRKVFISNKQKDPLKAF